MGLKLKKIGSFLNNNFQMKNIVTDTSFSSYNSYTKKAAEQFNFLDLVQKWGDLAGKTLSRGTLPIYQSNHVLHIITEHPTEAFNIKCSEKMLILKISKEFPFLRGKIKHLRFTHDNKKFHALKKNTLKKKTSEKFSMSNVNKYDPKVVQLQQKAKNLVKEIEDPLMQKYLQDIYLQCNLKAIFDEQNLTRED